MVFGRSSPVRERERKLGKTHADRWSRCRRLRLDQAYPFARSNLGRSDEIGRISAIMGDGVINTVGCGSGGYRQVPVEGRTWSNRDLPYRIGWSGSACTDSALGLCLRDPNNLRKQPTVHNDCSLSLRNFCRLAPVFSRNWCAVQTVNKTYKII
jgi:hypothetical protein